jgi:hypothetical protein
MLDSIVVILIGVACIAYALTYMSGKYYLRTDGFQTETQTQKTEQAPNQPKKEGRVIMEYPTDPSARTQIQDLDDYDATLVYQNESDRELTTELRNKLMSQRPMAWPGLPPSSAQFQAGLRETFQNAKMTVPDDAKPFDSISGVNMYPPDTNKAENEERRILQTYKPQFGGDVTTYDPRDAAQLIENIYTAKGLIPTVAHENGTNVYEIVGVRRKDEKIVYEDEEGPVAREPVKKAGEATIVVPQVVNDLRAASDPYYDTATKSRQDKWDYTSWTPGLERMFAPTEPKQNWY